MTDFMHLAGIAATVCAIAVFSLIVLHERIREGVVIKVGLVVCVLSMLALLAIQLGAGQEASTARADASLRIGLAVVCIGIVLRARMLSRLRHTLNQDESSTQQVRSTIYKITEPVRQQTTMMEQWLGLRHETSPAQNQQLK